MNEIYCLIGKGLCASAGILLGIILIALILHVAVDLWISFSNKFRSVCKAESLIHEYKKERKEYLEWKTAKLWKK